MSLANAPNNNASQLLRELSALRRQLWLEQERQEQALLGQDQALRVQVFYLGGRSFALPLATVQEAVSVAALEPLSESPNYVLGSLNLRGELLPILDFAACIDCKRAAPALSDVFLICDAGGQRFGLWLEGIGGVSELNDAAIAAAVSASGAAALCYGLVQGPREALELVSVARLARLAQPQPAPL